MSSQTAVASASLADSSARLKQTALLFDEITLFGLGTWLWDAEQATRRPRPEQAATAADLEWLRDRGVVSNPDTALTEGQVASVRASIQSFHRAGATPGATALAPLPPDVEEIVRSAGALPVWELDHLWHRLYAAEARRLRGIDAVVVSEQSPRSAATAPRDRVLSVVVRTLPLPDESTPWEELLDFRQDAEARGHLIRLKHWINDFAASDRPRSAVEMQQEIEYLVQEYTDSVRLHRMKFSLGAMEYLVTMAAEVGENILKLRWSQAARALFAFRQHHLQLLEAERQAPGRELVYIADASQRFSKPQRGGR